MTTPATITSTITWWRGRILNQKSTGWLLDNALNTPTLAHCFFTWRSRIALLNVGLNLNGFWLTFALSMGLRYPSLKSISRCTPAPVSTGAFLIKLYQASKMEKAIPITGKAIVTKYIAATNTRPSRIKASDEDGNTITIPYDHSLSHGQRYAKAAVALCEKMGWSTNLVGGHVKDGYVFVTLPK